MNSAILWPTVGLFISSLGWAQPNQNDRTSPKVAQSLRARVVATDLIKTGDATRALIEIRSGVKRGPAAMAEEAQIVGELCAIATSLAAAQHASSRDAAQLAVSHGAKVKDKVSRRESAYVDAKLGELMEWVGGDAAKAQEFYRSALALDASRQDADAGLKRLARLQALLRGKEAENVVLRSGAK